MESNEDFGSSFGGVGDSDGGEGEVVPAVGVSVAAVVVCAGVEERSEEPISFDTPRWAIYSGTLKKWTVPVVEEQARTVLVELKDKEQMEAGRDPLRNSQSLAPVCVLKIRIIVPFLEAEARSTPFSERVSFCRPVLWQLTMQIGATFKASKMTALPLCGPKLLLLSLLLLVPLLLSPGVLSGEGSNCWNARMERSEDDKSHAISGSSCGPTAGHGFNISILCRSFMQDTS